MSRDRTRARRRQAARGQAAAEPPRVFGMEPGTARRTAFWIIAGAAFLRLAYVVVVADYGAMRPPDTGPDSDMYVFVAEHLHRLGVLAPGVAGLPFSPAGYPVFLAGAFSWFGLDVRGPIVAQQVLLAAGMWSAYRLAYREISDEVALLTAGLLALAPGLGWSSTVYMYEPLLAVAAVVSVDLVSSAARQAEVARVLARGGAGMLVAGLGATLQPKLLALAPLLLAWLAWRTRPAAAVALCLVPLLVGPGALVVRNWAADGTPVLSANLGFTMLGGFNDHASGGPVDPRLTAASCEGRQVSLDPGLDATWRACALDWIGRNPGRAVLLAPAKAAHFWMPMAGTLAERGSWAHPLDPQRWLPESVGRSSPVRAAGALAGALWMLLTLGLVARGARVVWSHSRAGAWLVVAPVAVFLAVSLVTVGDARFRIPVTPFTTMLVAAALHRPATAWAARVTRSRAVSP